MLGNDRICKRHNNLFKKAACMDRAGGIEIVVRAERSADWSIACLTAKGAGATEADKSNAY